MTSREYQLKKGETYYRMYEALATTDELLIEYRDNGTINPHLLRIISKAYQDAVKISEVLSSKI